MSGYDNGEYQTKEERQKLELQIEIFEFLKEHLEIHKESDYYSSDYTVSIILKHPEFRVFDVILGSFTVNH